MKTGVFGLGNVLRRDDGFGPSVVRRLAASYVLPADVRDLGTPGLDLPSHLVGLDAVIVVDAAHGPGAPGPAGTLHTIERGVLLRGAMSGPLVTGHDADLRWALAVIDLLGDLPGRLCLVGVVPEDVGDGIGLTPAVERALAPACDAVLERLRRWGVVAVPRRAALAAGDWWRG